MFTNAQILSSVLTAWLSPLITQVGSERLSALPVLNAIQNKIRSSGWVSPNWSLLNELYPIINRAGARIAEPFVASYLSRFSDDQIPNMAHSIVDAALANGSLELFEGRITFDINDLKRLKRLLDLNLPMVSGQSYHVKTEMPNMDDGNGSPDNN